MIRLITDTSCLYSPTEAKELGFISNPLTVTIAGKSYYEFVDIQDIDFLKLIQEGNVPTSSQPPVGMVLEAIESFPPEDEIIYLCMADGLSGTYQSVVGALTHLDENRQSRVHVINSRTLCGPHRHLVHDILNWIKENKSIEEIKTLTETKIQSIQSFLLPQDFGFLKRGGRCTPLAAAIGGLLKIQPVVKQTADGKRLDKFITGRSFDIAINKIISSLKESGLDKKKIYVSHAFAKQQAEKVKEKLLALSPNLSVEVLALSCAFITQGGPHCVAIQSIDI